MGLFSFFWDLSQEQRLREARSTADGHAVDNRATRSELGEVRDAAERLALVNQALWEIVQERLGLMLTILRRRCARLTPATVGSMAG
jgi:hypothetical protein